MMCIDYISTIVIPPCVLHKVCEIHSETFNESWLEASAFPPPASTAVRDGSGDRPKQVRDALATYFST